MKLLLIFGIIFLIGCSPVKNNLTDNVITDFVIHEKSDSLDILFFPPYIVSDDSKPNEYSDIIKEYNLIGSDSIRVDKFPEPIYIGEPKYPIIAKKRELEGEVYIRIWIKKDGTIRKAKAIIASDDIFVEPALIASMDWKLTPAEKDGKSIEVSTFVPIKFVLPAPLINAP
jgi:TonB family protein